MPSNSGSTDTNYETQHRTAVEIEKAADSMKAELPIAQMSTDLEATEGAVNDAATGSAAAELAAALRSMTKSIDDMADAAMHYRATLEKSHGGVQEAADSSPAEAVAQPGFYQH